MRASPAQRRGLRMRLNGMGGIVLDPRRLSKHRAKGKGRSVSGSVGIPREGSQRVGQRPDLFVRMFAGNCEAEIAIFWTAGITDQRREDAIGFQSASQRLRLVRRTRNEGEDRA